MKDSNTFKPISPLPPALLMLFVAAIGILFFNGSEREALAGIIWICSFIVIGIAIVLVQHRKNEKWFGSAYRTRPKITREGQEYFKKKEQRERLSGFHLPDVNDVSDAHKVLREVGMALLFIGILQGIIGIFLTASWFIDAAITILLGLWIWKSPSLIAAYVFLVYSILVVIATTLNALGITKDGGTNVILALLLVWYAIQTIHVTKKLRELKN